jgi:hypothetical protein
MLSGHEGFFESLSNIRTLWVKGRPGGYKTSLCYRLAYDLLNSDLGYRYFLSNLKDVWSDGLKDIQPRIDELGDKYLDSVILLDEGGLFLPSGQALSDIISFVRKYNILFMVPCVSDVPRALKMLRCWPGVNLMNFGIDAIQYHWRVYCEDDEVKGSFWWFNPKEIYGIYSTSDKPVDCKGIDEWLIEQKNNDTQGKFIKRTVLSVERSGGVNLDSLNDAISEIEDKTIEIRRATISVSKIRR